MKNNSPVLEIKDLAVRIGGKRIIDDVSFPVRSGEILAIVGESGSGKTMTALSVLDLLPASAERESGKVLFRGMDIFSLSTEEKRQTRGRDIAMVFQEPFTALNPVMRIKDQIEEVFYAHGMCSKNEISEKIAGLLRTVKLPQETVFSYPHELSGGMRQRVMLAAALACDPSVLILDEPTTALDVSIQKHVLQLIQRIQQERHLAILFITHDFSVVNMVADRVCVMRGGSIVERGNKKDVLEDPKHEYTRQLVACIPRLGDVRRRLPVVRS